MSRELAPLVVGRGPPNDARALAARALALPPTNPSETPWKGIEVSLPDGELERPFAPVPRAERDAPRFLRDALERAVHRSLAGARRVAVMTGGVDSSALLAIVVRWAARTGNSALAVTLDFASDGDDRPHVRALAGHLGCEVLRVRPEDAAPRAALVRAGIDAAPVTWPMAPLGVELMARARQAGADRVLTGTGGDDLLDGEPRSLARLAAAGRPLRAIDSARRMRGFEPARAPVLSWVVRPLLGAVAPAAVRAWRARGRRLVAPDWAGPTLRDVLCEQSEFRATRGSAPRRDGNERLWEFVSRPSWVALACFRRQEELASGVRRCDPYLDLELVRAVTSLPPEWLVSGGRRRGLLRDAMGRELPLSVRERQGKARFEPAIERFFAAAGGLRSFLPFARAERLAELGIVEPRAFAAAAESFVATPRAEGWLEVWPALATEAYLRGRRGSPT